MAGNSITMNQLKQFILLLAQGHSNKSIVRITGIAKNTVKKYRQTVASQPMSVHQLIELDEMQLKQVLCAPHYQEEEDRSADFLMRLDYFRSELENNKHVTKMLLWEEYKRDFPKGYQYSQFCHYLQLYDKSNQAVIVMNHKPADKLFLDYTGDKLHYVNRESGEIIPCEVFLATMGYSNFLAVEATHTQQMEDIILATVNCLEQIGGSPGAFVPDNLKSAVTTANRYEPRINDAFLNMANHYGVAVIPARAGQPTDKAKVERSVKLAYQRLFAALRKQTFYSLAEINAALRELAQSFNERTMQQYGASRRELLERDECPLLRALPEHRYELKDQKELTVQQNSHVYLSKRRQYFSAPYQYIGMKVQVIISSSLISIYYKGDCIATHAADTKNRYNTHEMHLPSHHQIVLSGMSEQKLKDRAAQIGLSVLRVIEVVFANSQHPEQAFKATQGILALEKKTSKAILLESCAIALEYNVCTYRQIERLASGSYANRALHESLEIKSTPLPQHGNIRGARTYQINPS